MTRRFVDDVLPSRGTTPTPTVRTLLRRLGQLDAPEEKQRAGVRAWLRSHPLNDSLRADLPDRGWADLIDEPQGHALDVLPVAIRGEL